MIGLCDYCGDEKEIFISYRWRKKSCEDCYKSKKMVKRLKHTKKNGKKVTELRDELDRKFSIYIRTLYMNENNMIECYTCGEHMTMSEAQCGHFNSRQDSCTRWMVDNCKPQCNYCNTVLYGNMVKFKQRLELEHPGSTDILNQMARSTCNFTRSDLMSMLEDITKKTKGINKESLIYLENPRSKD